MNISPYLGNNVDPVNIKEFGYRGLLQEGETLLAIFDGVLIDDRGRRVGGVSLTDFVALTDQRLITWARGFFNDMVDGFQWKDVDVIEAKTWDPLHGRISLAFRLLPEVPRSRRINVKGFKTSSKPVETSERIIINTLDYMPAADVPVMAEMVEWIGDQVVAGISGEELLAAFVDMFPLPEAEPAPFVSPQPQQPVIESSSSKRSWWSLGAQETNREEKKLENVDSPDKLIAAYELQRSGDSSSSSGIQNVSPARSSGVAPFGHFGFYDVSRGMRLLFEGPRRVGGSLNRVNDVLIDTAELIEDMQDPQMRKRTLSGLRYAMDMQEGQSGLLGAVAPVVRAVLGSGGGHRDSTSHHHAEGDGERPGVRRIQVRAAVRQREPSIPQSSTSIRSDNDTTVTENSSMSERDLSSSPRESSIGDVRIPTVSTKAKIRHQITTHKKNESSVGVNNALQSRDSSSTNESTPPASGISGSLSGVHDSDGKRK